MKKKIRLGTRGSPLALIQAEEIKRRLLQAWPQLQLDAEIEIIPIRTTGDWKPEHKDRRFIEMGGNKGLFTKEIEEALQDDQIDMAVHSLKDVSSVLPPGVEIGAIIARNDPRDAFLGRIARTLDALPQGAVVGTSSLRRQAQILARRPDLRVVPLRGNIETRLKKMGDGQVDATLLAAAGLARLGIDPQLFSILPTDIMLPAAAQGALGVEIRSEAEEIRALLKPLDDAMSHICVTAERAVMRAIGGTCRTPAGAYATLSAQGLLALDVLVARADGTDLLRLSAFGKPEEADKIGEALGEKLRALSPADLFVV